MGCLSFTNWFIWLVYTVTLIVCFIVGHTIAIASPWGVWLVWTVCGVVFELLVIALTD